MNKNKFEKAWHWGLELAQKVKSTDSRDLKLNFQQPHGDPQPSTGGSDVLFWHAGI